MLAGSPACPAMCQQTLFALARSDMQQADEYYEARNYPLALKMYLNVARKQRDAGIDNKIARCYYQLKKYHDAIEWWEKHRDKEELPLTDVYQFAESLATVSEYNRAMDAYRDYLTRDPENPVVIKKLWRMQNIRFLYEDSLHYAVTPIAINTGYAELCAVPYERGILFMSNRRDEVNLVHKLDGSRNTPYYRLYHARTFQDTIENIGALNYGNALSLDLDFKSKFHIGPAALYAKGTKMIYAATSNVENKNGERPLQLYFAELHDGLWKETSAFQFNSLHHSLTHPAITGDGSILYFSSDMKGGMGGRDLYRSELKGGSWTTPVNLGEPVNTPGDEVFPFIQRNQVLYFSSDGHAGLGGLDIFKSDILGDGFGEVQNVGYPINSASDDFGLTIDSLSTHGYLTSNRRSGGYDDDLYEFDVDLQTYPLTIEGTIKYKEHSWSDSSELKILPRVTIALIDHIRNVQVFEGTSDDEGKFSLVIPYFSKYIIRISSDDAGENIVSLEIPKHKREETRHEIVIVKDAFRPHENSVVR